MDGLIGRYRIRMKTRKWTNRLFFHLLDMSMVNAYILCHRLHKGQARCFLPDFRIEVAETLYLLSIPASRGRGRPLSHSASPAPAPSKVKTYFPNAKVRYDQIGHWCKFLDRSGKKTCKMANCKSETQSFCTKCNIHLQKTAFLIFICNNKN